MTSPTPRISVVIPAFNAAWCIRTALDSVLAQDWGDFEIIVVNDGSTDETSAILSQYGTRLQVVSQRNSGLSAARNAGIRRACGEYVALLDADDSWLPTKLSRQMALMTDEPDLVFCSTTARIQTADGTHLGEWRCGARDGVTLEQIFAVNAHIAGSGSAVLARRHPLLELGGFDEGLRSLEDIDMWMRLAAISGYVCIDEPLAVISKRRDSMSGNLNGMRTSALMVMKKNRHLLEKPFRGGFWQAAYATVLADYAKWEYRSGRRLSAVAHLTEGLLRAPVRRGRLILGLLLAMILGQRI